MRAESVEGAGLEELGEKLLAGSEWNVVQRETILQGGSLIRPPNVPLAQRQFLPDGIYIVDPTSHPQIDQFFYLLAPVKDGSRLSVAHRMEREHLNGWSYQDPPLPLPAPLEVLPIQLPKEVTWWRPVVKTEEIAWWPQRKEPLEDKLVSIIQPIFVPGWSQGDLHRAKEVYRHAIDNLRSHTTYTMDYWKPGNQTPPGRVVLRRIFAADGSAGLEIAVYDAGPGIGDLGWAVTPGITTGNFGESNDGWGLPLLIRNADEVAIHSKDKVWVKAKVGPVPWQKEMDPSPPPGRLFDDAVNKDHSGTTVVARIWPRAVGLEEGGLRPFDREEAVEVIRHGIFGKKSSLWEKTVPSDASDVVQWLGWVEAPTQYLEELPKLEAVAEELKREGIEHIVLIGTGGSLWGAVTLYRIPGASRKSGYPDLLWLDLTNPDAIRRLVDALGNDFSKTVFVAVSKSGTNPDTNFLYRYFRQQIDDKNHFLAITDPGCAIDQEPANRFRHTFWNNPEIGGRFSALSFFGLVPAVLAGVDARPLLESAQSLQQQMASQPEEATLILDLAGVLLSALQEGKDTWVFRFPPELQSLGPWVQQLFNESLGKSSHAPVVIADLPFGRAAPSLESRRIFELHFLSTRTGESVSRPAGASFAKVRLKEPQSDVGRALYQFEVLVSLLGFYLQVHPFNQPDVQRSKRLVAETFESVQRFPPEGWVDTDGIRVTINNEARRRLQRGGRANPLSARKAMEVFFDLLKPDETLTLLTYTYDDASLQKAFQGVRKRILENLGRATLFGVGPRYQHSDLQLIGGKKRAAIVLMTFDTPQQDLPVPESTTTFSQLTLSQVLGNYRWFQDDLALPVLWLQFPSIYREDISRIQNELFSHIQSSSTGLEELRVLVLSRDGIFHDSIRKMIEREFPGAIVQTAFDERQAHETLKSKPDLVIAEKRNYSRTDPALDAEGFLKHAKSSHSHVTTLLVDGMTDAPEAGFSKKNLPPLPAGVDKRVFYGSGIMGDRIGMVGDIHRILQEVVAGLEEPLVKGDPTLYLQHYAQQTLGNYRIAPLQIAPLIQSLERDGTRYLLVIPPSGYGKKLKDLAGIFFRHKEGEPTASLSLWRFGKEERHYEDVSVEKPFRELRKTFDEFVSDIDAVPAGGVVKINEKVRASKAAGVPVDAVGLTRDRENLTPSASELTDILNQMIQKSRLYTSLEERLLPKEEDPFFSDDTIDLLDPERDERLKSELHELLRKTLSMLGHLDVNEDPDFFKEMADQLEGKHAEDDLSDLSHLYDLLDFIRYEEITDEEGDPVLEEDGEVIRQERGEKEQWSILDYIRSLRWNLADSIEEERTYLIRQPVVVDFAKVSPPHSIRARNGDIFLVDFGVGSSVIHFVNERRRVEILEAGPDRFEINRPQPGLLPRHAKVHRKAWEFPLQRGKNLTISGSGPEQRHQGVNFVVDELGLRITWDPAHPPRFLYRLGLPDAGLEENLIGQVVRQAKGTSVFMINSTVPEDIWKAAVVLHEHGLDNHLVLLPVPEEKQEEVIARLIDLGAHVTVYADSLTTEEERFIKLLQQQDVSVSDPDPLWHFYHEMQSVRARRRRTFFATLLRNVGIPEEAFTREFFDTLFATAGLEEAA